MDSKLFTRVTNRHGDSFNEFVPQSKSMLERGIDPKPELMKLCEPMCHFWKEKLQRCEKKLVEIIKVNPSKSCLYPMRDYVTCVEACVQPKIHANLVGNGGHGKIFN